MAGFKHRFIIIKAENTALANLNNIITADLKEQFGDSILSLVDHLTVLETYPNCSVAIIRCNIEIYKYVTYSLITMGKIGKKKVGIQILFVSGILRKAKEKLIKFLNKNI